MANINFNQYQLSWEQVIKEMQLRAQYALRLAADALNVTQPTFTTRPTETLSTKVAYDTIEIPANKTFSKKEAAQQVLF